MSDRVTLFIPYLNRPDLLGNAIASAINARDVDIYVIDNSGLPGKMHYACMIKPDVPLTFTQSHNLMLDIATNNKEDFYLWMHSDAETCPADLERLIEMARTEQRKWGVIFTYYDTLAAYNTKAMQEIGGYDTDFRDYFSDNDVYRRLKLAGYELLESHIQTKHVGSQTINSDPALRFKHQILFPMSRDLYKAKWGGEPGRERFDRPYNGMIG